ncbi:hypothetical protein [Xanthobacter tagetidis]|nr:hypothetical protein [Xanthobacter tagetidis]MBB6307810.1 hypothetical protein [Xanthobacter tagetidis]
MRHLPVMTRHAAASAALAAALCAGGAAPASAQSRPYAPSMSCSEVAALVRAKGAVLLSTSPTTFDRYVSAANYCSVGEVLKNQWIATRDNPQCFIGYTCFVPSRDNWVP